MANCYELSESRSNSNGMVLQCSICGDLADYRQVKKWSTVPGFHACSQICLKKSQKTHTKEWKRAIELFAKSEVAKAMR